VVMDMLGVNRPDFGQLLSTMAYNEGQPIDTRQFIAPRAEAEVAFMLARDLTGPGVTAADVLRATDCVMPCFEIVDSRILDWKIKIQDTIADNASCGVFSLGARSISHWPAWCLKRTAKSSAPPVARRRWARPSMPWCGWPTRWARWASRSRPAR
jgi:2-keto-4-pentenoate hydratase